MGKGIHEGEGPKRGGDHGEDDKEEGSEGRTERVYVGEGPKRGGTWGRRGGGGCIDSIRKPNTLNILHPPSSPPFQIKSTFTFSSFNLVLIIPGNTTPARVF